MPRQTFIPPQYLTKENHISIQYATVVLAEPNKRLSNRRELRYGQKGSFSIELAGKKRGQWYDHEAREGGGALRLIGRVNQTSISEAIDWARDWLGLDSLPALRNPVRMPGREKSAAQSESDSAPQSPPDEPVPDSEDAERAEKIEKGTRDAAWWRGKISAAGEDEPTALYLRRRRFTGAIPGALGAATEGYYRNGVLIDHLPVMVGFATQPDGAETGVHLTYLTEDGHKADLDPAKKMRGSIDGGAVRLTEAGEKLCLAEGIETALSVMEATGLPTWSALSAGNLVAQDLPAEVRTVIIAADNDKSRAGIKAAWDAARRFIAEGKKVRIAMPIHIIRVNSLFLH